MTTNSEPPFLRACTATQAMTAGRVLPCVTEVFPSLGPAAASVAAGPLFLAPLVNDWRRAERRAVYGTGIGRQRDRIASVKAAATECLRRGA